MQGFIQICHQDIAGARIENARLTVFVVLKRSQDVAARDRKRVIRTSMCAEERDGVLYVFMPPTRARSRAVRR